MFYGAAEFSRDCDVAILCEPGNLARLQAALDELQARTIAARTPEMLIDLAARFPEATQSAVRRFDKRLSRNRKPSAKPTAATGSHSSRNWSNYATADADAPS